MSRRYKNSRVEVKGVEPLSFPYLNGLLHVYSIFLNEQNRKFHTNRMSTYKLQSNCLRYKMIKPCENFLLLGNLFSVTPVTV